MNYKRSSFAGYLSKNQRLRFIDYSTTLSYTGGDTAKGREVYKEFMIDGIAENISNPLNIAKGNGIVGNEDFLSKIKKGFWIIKR